MDTVIDQNLTSKPQKPKLVENMGLRIEAAAAIRQAEAMHFEKFGIKPKHSEMVNIMASSYIREIQKLSPIYIHATEITNRSLSNQ